jgi:hypothetical protein
MATTLELKAQVAELKKRVEELERVKTDLQLPDDGGVGQRVKELENKYRMLNARLNKNKNNGGKENPS